LRYIQPNHITRELAKTFVEVHRSIVVAVTHNGSRKVIGFCAVATNYSGSGRWCKAFTCIA
jgi:hypothetical protein